MSLATRIVIGVAAGLAVGVFLGDFASPFITAGDIYVGLLQMTVLPYVTISLVSKIGGLDFEEARRLAGRAGGILVLLWVIALGTVFLMPLSLPDWQASVFFSASLVEAPADFNFIEQYLPINPFHSLANNLVPAAVLFSIFTGVALIGVPHRERVLEPLEVLSKTLSRITDFVVRLSPAGTFCIAAGAAGTLVPAQLAKLAGYVSTFTLAAALLTFLVLPAVVALLTPWRGVDVIRGFREAGITAFATGRLFAVLPIVITDVKRLLMQQDIDEQTAQSSADVYVPLAYPFPDSGRLLAMLFIPFAAWYVGRPLELGDYPLFLSIGVLSFFGSPIAAVPFLLGFFGLPMDLFPLFLVAGIWCARVGDMTGAMHLTAFSLLCAAWSRGLLQLRTGRLVVVVAVTVPVTLGVMAANHFIVTTSMAGQEGTRDLIAQMGLLTRTVEIVVDEQPSPNPDPLAAGETRLQRIERTGELRVGYVPGSAPFSHRNGAGELVGFDVDLIARLAEILHVRLRMVPYERDELPEALAADQFDIAIGGLSSSLEHFGSYFETIAYLELHAAIVALDSRVDELDSLEEVQADPTLTLGYVTIGHLARARKHRIPDVEIVAIDSYEQFLRGELPEIDALMTTAETGAVMTMMYPQYSVVVPRGVHARVPVVFALQLDLELERYVDRWIRLNKEDGTIGELYDYWILGKRTEAREPRWSILRDVLGWVE